MNVALAHRGPNADGTFLKDEVGLAHRRLSILDLSAGANQPIHSSCGMYTAVYNGEVYNFKEIAKDLNVNLKTHSDTEVVLEAYAKWGPRFVDRLNGMFALAIYDHKNQRLDLFRDRIGIKPLYYYWDGKDFLFASEAKAILSAGISPEINLESLKDSFFLEYVPGTQSIFKNIFKLRPGHSLRVDKTGIKVERYYNLLDHISSSRPAQRSEYEMNQEFSQLLSRATSGALISDVPIGTFLSGGTDSSLVTAKAQQVTEIPMSAFTVKFDSGFDESSFANDVAMLLGVSHHTIPVRQQDAIGLIKDLPSHYDDLFFSQSAIPTFMLCQSASDHVKVALSGDGGDELFMGYGYYNWMRRMQILNGLGAGHLRHLTSLAMAQFGSRFERAGRVLDYPNRKNMWLHIWSQENYMFNESEISELFGSKYEHTSTIEDWQEINNLPIHYYDKVSLFDLKYYLPDNLLYKVDIASMAHGLEVRVPLLDHNVVEYALGRSWRDKIRGKDSKHMLKKELLRHLPPDLVYREKWGFAPPIQDWLLKDYSGLIDTYLSPKKIESQGLLNAKFISNLIIEFRSGKTHHYKRLWSLLMFQFWLERYIPENSNAA